MRQQKSAGKVIKVMLIALFDREEVMYRHLFNFIINTLQHHTVEYIAKNIESAMEKCSSNPKKLPDVITDKAISMKVAAALPLTNYPALIIRFSIHL